MENLDGEDLQDSTLADLAEPPSIYNGLEPPLSRREWQLLRQFLQLTRSQQQTAKKYDISLDGGSARSLGARPPSKG